MSLRSPAGFYYPTNLNRPTQDECDIVNSFNAHRISHSRGYAIVESLGADLLTRFPKSHSLKIRVSPDISKKIKIDGLNAASLDLEIYNIKADSENHLSNSCLIVRTVWTLSIRQVSSVKSIRIELLTSEPPAPERLASLTPEHEGSGGADFQPLQNKTENLDHVHPTFKVHQNLMGFLRTTKDDFGESMALNTAKLSFELADKQYRHRHLRETVVSIKGLEDSRMNSFSACRIALSRLQYEQAQASMLVSTTEPRWHQAYVALGSNVGDRISLIESACHEMDGRGLRVNRTGALYETKAMYLEDQNPFINGACEVRSL